MESIFHHMSQVWPGNGGKPGGDGKKPKQNNEAGRGRWVAPICAGVAMAAGSGFSVISHQQGIVLSPAPACADEAVPVPEDGTVEPATGLAFPPKLSPSTVNTDNVVDGGKKGSKDGRELVGVGVRIKRLFGIANLKVYAFGIFLDMASVKRALRPKYHGLSEAALKTSKWLLEDLATQDVGMTVRLVISYKNLKIGQVRNAFEESIGGKMEKITGKPQKDLLHAFTKLFSDDIELQRGTIIDLSRLPGYVIEAKINGKSIGSTKSALVSRALFELYVGEKPFDSKAEESVRDALVKEFSK